MTTAARPKVKALIGARKGLRASTVAKAVGGGALGVVTGMGIRELLKRRQETPPQQQSKTAFQRVVSAGLVTRRMGMSDRDIDAASGGRGSQEYYQNLTGRQRRAIRRFLKSKRKRRHVKRLHRAFGLHKQSSAVGVGAAIDDSSPASISPTSAAKRIRGRKQSSRINAGVDASGRGKKVRSRVGLPLDNEREELPAQRRDLDTDTGGEAAAQDAKFMETPPEHFKAANYLDALEAMWDREEQAARDAAAAADEQREANRVKAELRKVAKEKQRRRQGNPIHNVRRAQRMRKKGLKGYFNR